MKRDEVLAELIRINRLRIRYLKSHMENYRGIMHLILFYVRRNPGSCQDDIVSFYRLDKTNVARDCRRLEEMGHLRRSQDPENRRKYQLFLTESGKAYAEYLDGVHQDYAGLLSDGFTEQEWNTLESLLDRMSRNAMKHYDES